MSETIYIDEKSTDTQLKIETRYNNVRISIEGSKSFRDIMTALSLTSHVDVEGVKISHGVFDAVKSIWNELFMSIISYGKNVSMVVSGHSLGGGIAQVVAYEFLRRGYNNIDLVLTGSIRVGNRAFKRYLEQGCKSIMWQDYGNDPVTLLWPWKKRVGTINKIKPRTFPWLDFDLVNGHHMRYWD